MSAPALHDLPHFSHSSPQDPLGFCNYLVLRSLPSSSAPACRANAWVIRSRRIVRGVAGVGGSHNAKAFSSQLRISSLATWFCREEKMVQKTIHLSLLSGGEEDAALWELLKLHRNESHKLIRDLIVQYSISFLNLLVNCGNTTDDFDSLFNNLNKNLTVLL